MMLLPCTFTPSHQNDCLNEIYFFKRRFNLNDTFDLAVDVLIMSQHCFSQMGACLTPALPEQNAPVYLMVPGSVGSAQLATLAMVSSAKI